MSASAVLYVRVSTDEQVREGQSLETQEANLRAYAALRGLDVVEGRSRSSVPMARPTSSEKSNARRNVRSHRMANSHPIRNLCSRRDPT